MALTVAMNLLGWVLLTPPTAATSCGGDASDLALVVSCGNRDPGRTTPAPPGRSSRLPPGWTTDFRVLPTRPPDVPVCAVATGELGVTWVETLRDPAGQIVNQTSYCLPVGSAPAGASAPRPPTVQEIIDAVPWPEPATSFSPTAEGVTGLETWLWYDAPTTVQVSTSLNGWNVTGTGQATRYAWNTGDGSILTATRPGSIEQPAARHTYETKGNYSTELTVTWSGQFTVSGPGGTFTRNLPSVLVSGDQPYTVVEVRSVLVG